MEHNLFPTSRLKCINEVAAIGLSIHEPAELSSGVVNRIEHSVQRVEYRFVCPFAGP